MPKVEWSGILFYNIQGSIQDVENMVVTPIDILLRDIGNATFTAYEFDEEVMEFIEKNDLYMAHHGHVHSHNTMSVFFSGTDTEELQDNCQTHNVYLSLIVNNFMDMSAKLAFLGKPTPSLFSCMDENGQPYDIEIAGPTHVMFTYDCDIELPQQEISVNKDFIDIFKRVVKDKEEKAKKAAAEAAAKAKSTPNQYSGYGQGGYRGDHGDFTKGHQPQLGFHVGGLADNFEVESDDDLSDYGSSEFDEFFQYCLKGGTGAEETEDLEDSLDQVTHSSIGEETVNMIMNNYAVYYENYFLNEGEVTDSEHFMKVLEEFVLACDVYEKDHPWLSVLRDGLNGIGNKFEALNLNRNEE